MSRIPAIELPLTKAEAIAQCDRNLQVINQAGALRRESYAFMDVLQQNLAPRARLRKLQRVAQKISAAVTPHSACRANCSYCCYMPVAINQIEAEEISRHTGRKPAAAPERRDRQSTSHYHRQPCPFLMKGRCSIYDVRPMACRLMFNLADSPYHCNTDIEPEDSHVMLLNLKQLEYGFTAAFLAYPFADIRDYFPAPSS